MSKKTIWCYTTMLNGPKLTDFKESQTNEDEKERQCNKEEGQITNGVFN